MKKIIALLFTVLYTTIYASSYIGIQPTITNYFNQDMQVSIGNMTCVDYDAMVLNDNKVTSFTLKPNEQQSPTIWKSNSFLGCDASGSASFSLTFTDLVSKNVIGTLNFQLSEDSNWAFSTTSTSSPGIKYYDLSTSQNWSTVTIDVKDMSTSVKKDVLHKS